MMKRLMRITTRFTFGLAFLLLANCSAPAPTPTAPAPPTSTATLTATAPPPTAAPSATPDPLIALRTLTAQTPAPAAQATNATTAASPPTSAATPTPLSPTDTPTPPAAKSSITKIAFMSDRDHLGEPMPPSCNQRTQDVYIMDPDGSNQRRVTSGKGYGYNSCSSAISLRWHPDGQRLFLFNGGSGYKNTIIETTTGRIVGERSWKFDPAFSPDGNTVIYSNPVCVGTFCPSQIFILDLVSGHERQVPNAPADTERGWLPLSWSPDGKFIVYGHNISGRSTESGLFIMNADGSGARRLNNRYIESTAWSPDGRKIAFGSGFERGGNPGTGMDVWVIDVDGKNEVNLTKTSRMEEWWPSWSPDSKQLVFQNRISQPSQIFVINADGTGLKQLTTIGSNSNPAWVR